MSNVSKNDNYYKSKQHCGCFHFLVNISCNNTTNDSNMKEKNVYNKSNNCRPNLPGSRFGR
jgi:hypothetical protein